MLHNYLRKTDVHRGSGSTQAMDNASDEGVVADGLQAIDPLRNMRSTNAAIEIRQKFTRYFNTSGSVEWQSGIVEQAD